jgi:tRNA threonylcarbamoyladenosine biosynthesis protein TsaB
VKLLALDTSTEACSAAVWVNGAVTERYAVLGRGHAEHILPMVHDLLAEADLPLRGLDAIAFGRGPGAFTGVRIATSVAQGLALGADLPVVPVSDLAAVGLQAFDRATAQWGQQACQAWVCLDARMGEVYHALIEQDEISLVRVGPEGVEAPGQLTIPPKVAGSRRVGVGHGFSAYPQWATQVAPQLDAVWPDLLPRAGAVARLGVALWRSGVRLAAAQAQPSYVRNQVATQSNKV